MLTRIASASQNASSLPGYSPRLRRQAPSSSSNSPSPVSLPAPTQSNSNQTSSVSLRAFPSLSALTGSETISASATSVVSSDSTPPFKFVYLVPVIAVGGVILLIALIWLIQGCCTRKARVIEDAEDPGVLGGPRYEFIEPGAQPHLEGAQEVEKAYYEDGYEDVDWVQETDYRAHPPSAYRMRSETSAALMELYESDDGEEWEMPRHTSIRRGIMERVQKEQGWMDSLRAVAGSAFVNQGGSRLTPAPSKPRRRDSEAWFNDVRQRRANTASTKTSSTTTTTTTRHRQHQNQPELDLIPTPWSEETSAGFKIVQETPGGTEEPTTHLAARERGKAAIRDYFNYKLPPVGEGSVPRDHTTENAARISMLPLSPPRIMSPPLEDQLLFTPAEPMRSIHQGPSRGHGSGGSGAAQTLFTRLKDRKGKSQRKAAVAVDEDAPLPYPVAPLRMAKRGPAKLTKSRAQGGGVVGV